MFGSSGGANQGPSGLSVSQMFGIETPTSDHVPLVPNEFLLMPTTQVDSSQSVFDTPGQNATTNRFFDSIPSSSPSKHFFLDTSLDSTPDIPDSDAEISSERALRAHFGALLESYSQAPQSPSHTVDTTTSLTAPVSPDTLLSLASSYQQITEARLEILNKTFERKSSSQWVLSSRQLQEEQERSLILSERNSWMLIHALYSSRASPASPPSSPRDYDSKPQSQHQFITEFLQRNHSYHESAIVIQWLQDIAALELRASDESPTFPPIGASTLSFLLATKGPRIDPALAAVKSEIVSELDPDAPSRQGRKLHPDDVDAEKKYLAAVWRLVRAGRILDAQELCRRVGEPWRAASLGGFEPCHDPFLYPDNPDEEHAMQTEEGMLFVRGNPNRMLWKRACWMLSSSAENGPFSAYERAIYGALCGNLDAVVGVCTSWEDHLWSRLKVTVDSAIDRELAAHHSDPLYPPDDDDDENLLGLSVTEMLGAAGAKYEGGMEDHKMEIFDEILKLQVEGMNDPYHIIQTFVILDQRIELLEQLAKWVQVVVEDVPSPQKGEVRLRKRKSGLPKKKRVRFLSPPQLIRFAAHLANFLAEFEKAEEMSLGITRTQELKLRGSIAYQAIMQSYVELLISEEEERHVATYTAYLSPESQVETYARFLVSHVADGRSAEMGAEGSVSSEDHRERREQCLDLAERAGLDVNLITKKVVELIQEHGEAEQKDEPITAPTDLGSEFQSGRGVTADELAKIRAIEWLTFDPEQRAEAIIQSNTLARRFLLAHRIEAARRVVTETLPADSVHVVKKRWRYLYPRASKKKKARLEKAVSSAAEKQRIREENAVVEHTGYQKYLAALAAYDDWNRMLVNKPREPQSIPGVDLSLYDSIDAALESGNLKPSQKIWYQRQIEKYRKDIEEWRERERQLTRRAIESLYEVLEFPGGWMRDFETELNPSEDEIQRIGEMAVLRKQCIPTLLFLLHRVLYETEQYQESIQLADLVADEKNQLYQEFTREDLRSFLKKIRQSSLQILASGSAEPLEKL